MLTIIQFKNFVFLFPLRCIKIYVYKTIILSAVCMGMTPGLKLKVEHRLRAFDNRMLGKIFGPEQEEVAGGWRRLHSEELRNMYDSPNVVRMIKTRKIRWAEYVAHTGEMRNTKFWMQNLKGKGCSEDPGIDGITILEEILEK
jgi:hypothetical protein